jgi:hypothetical protein
VTVVVAVAVAPRALSRCGVRFRCEGAGYLFVLGFCLMLVCTFESDLSHRQRCIAWLNMLRRC